MFGARVLFVFAVLSFGGCEELSSEGCTITDESATCGDQFVFPLQLPVNITELHIHSKAVKSISNDNFEQYTELEVLDLSNCGIVQIDHDAFTTLANLNELNLAGNKEFSSQETFIDSSSLTKLNLSHTAVKTIPVHFFDGLPNLEELDLSYTLLPDSSIEALSTLSNLSTLILTKDVNNRFDVKEICEATHLENITFKIVGEEDIIEDCSVQKEVDEDNSTTESNDNAENTTAIVTIEQETETKESVTEESINDADPIDNVSDKTNESEDAEPKTENNEDGATTVPSEETTTTEANVKEDDENKDKVDNLEATKANQSEISPPPEESSNQEAKPDEPTPTSTEETTNASKEIDIVSDVDNGTNPDHANSEQKNGVMFSAVNPSADVDNAENNISEVTSQASQSSGTNVVLGIILTVMIVGAVGFGYKYWKNRRSGYRNANTEETIEEGKELQTIVTHHTDPEQN